MCNQGRRTRYFMRKSFKILPNSPLMEVTYVSQLALFAVIALISFLAYGSQILFRYLEPYQLEHTQTVRFNVLVACIWICYLRACFTNPGDIPLGWGTNLLDKDEIRMPNNDHHSKQRWCGKCEAAKPPRAHHCKICKRYSDLLNCTINGLFDNVS